MIIYRINNSAKFKICGKSPSANGIPFELWKHWRNSLNIWPKNYALANVVLHAVIPSH